MSETEVRTASDALPAAREAANSDEILRPQRLAELEQNAIDKGSEEQNIAAAVDEIRKKRKETYENIWDQGEIVERHVSRETARALEDDTAATGLRRATRDVSDQRKVEKHAPWIGTELAEPNEIARWEAAARREGIEVPKPTAERAVEKIHLMADDGRV